MNADAFRHFYEYHFTVNRKIWDRYVAPLPYEQFTQEVGYSHGSVRDQILHMMDADETWFAELQGIDPSPRLPAAQGDDREAIRAHWDRLEQMMRDYLEGLDDEALFEQPIVEPEEDQELIVWQVLVHVVNHGTDHRAQLLRVLNDLGVETSYQDYIFFVFEALDG